MIKRPYLYFASFFILIALSLIIQFKVYAVQQPVVIYLDRQSDYKHIYGNLTSLSDIDLFLDNKTGKQLTDMKISGDGLFDNVPWESYSAIKKWRLSSPDGQKTVYGQFKAIDGEIFVAGATLIYDITPPDLTFKLNTKSAGPDTLNITAEQNGQDKWSIHDYDFRISLNDKKFTNQAWRPRTSNIIELPLLDFATYKNGDTIKVYYQAKDQVGNITQILPDSFVIDKTPPVLYIKTFPSDSLSGDIQILAYDEYSSLGKMYISNDPIFIEDVKKMPYQENVRWQFDDRRVVWIKLSDSVGNSTEPYPAYLASLTSPTPNPSWTPTPSVNLPPTSVTQIPTPTINPTIAADPKYIEFQNKIANLEKKQKELEQTNKEIRQTVTEQGKEISLSQTLINSVISFLKSLFPFWK